MSATRLIRIPEYLEQFACIGPSCEDSCCAGWRIELDQPTFERYETLSYLNQEPLSNYMTKVQTNATARNYGEMILNERMECPMLTKERLCSIQLQWGEQQLSPICHSFPRVTNVVEGRYERSTVLSCPEAARKALLNPSGIKFVTREEEASDDSLYVRKIYDPRVGKHAERALYYDELRVFTIQLLQNRAYSLSDRLLILGEYCKRLQDIVESEAPPIYLHECISDMTAAIADGSIRSAIAGFPSDVPVQMKFLRELITMRVFVGVNSKRYLVLLQNVLTGLKYSGDSLKPESIQIYREAYEQYYAPFMEQHEYILENYWVSFAYRELFPRVNDHPLRDYVLAASHYALIRFHLIGLAAYYKENFNIKHVLDMIQTYSKTIDHGPQHSRNMIQLLERHGYVELKRAALLFQP